MSATSEAHPVPSGRVLNRRQSLRRHALALLGVSLLERWWTERGRLARATGAVALVLAIGALAFLPRWRIAFGPFGTEHDAQQYLQTLWQVVAAVVGVSVALIAFVFEAFVSSAERRHGGTLREFARQTHILVLFDLAAISLALDGLALAGLGATAPAGWTGFVASIASGLTLLVLLLAVPRVILRSLDPDQLTEMRLQATRALARGAVREQLIGQLVANELHAGRGSGLGQGIRGLSRGTPIDARRTGVLHDIRRGSLLRALQGLELSGERLAEVVVEVERTVGRGTPLLVVPEPIGRLRRWRVRRAFQIRRGSERLSSTALERALDRLGQQIVAAIRRGDETEWRALDQLLRDVLLELPRAVARLGLTFDDVVSRPGWFRRGPTERIFEILDAALQQALEGGSSELAGRILYSPYHVASAALRLPAPGLVAEAASFYVRTYYRVRRHAAAQSAAASEPLTAEVVEVLFELADRVGAHPLAFGDDDISTCDARANLERVLGSVMSLMRGALQDRDEAVADDVLRRLEGLTELWDYWHDDPRGAAQRGVLAELATLRFALASWALHLLGRAPERDQWLLWQRMATRLLDPLRSEEMTSAYWQLVDREKVLGVDYSFWFYDTKAGGVQSLGFEGKAALALVVGLALRAEGEEQIPFALEADRGWRVQELIAAVDRVETEAERYAPVFGAPAGALPAADPGTEAEQAIPTLEQVRSAFEAADSQERERAASRTRAAALDPEQVAKFKALAAKAVEEERILKPLLKARGLWRIMEAPDWNDLVANAWNNKAFYTGEPGYVGQEMVATQMGRRAGRSELAELVELFEGLRAEPLADDVAHELGSAVERIFRETGAPPLVVCPISWRLFEVLGVRSRGEETELEATGVSRAQAKKFNGVFRGAPVIDHPNLLDRVLVIDLAAVRMEERPTPGEVGAIPDVRGFDESAATAFVETQPRVFGSMPEDERVPWLREHVLLEIVIAWRLVLEDAERAHALALPAELARNP